MTNFTYCAVCQSGFFFDPSAVGERGCLPCNYSCGSCGVSGTYYDCVTCSATDKRVLTANRCPCISEYYENGTASLCVDCSVVIANCLTCYNDSFCLTCTQNQYIVTVSPGNQNCQSCAPPCASCSLSPNNCTSCDSSHFRFFNFSAHSCDCIMGYFHMSGISICEKCSAYLGSCA